jgi:type I restriction enzyme S subunit
MGMSDLDSLVQELPPSWALATLGDLVDYGRTNKAEPGEIDDSAWVLELEDVEKDSSRLLQRITFGERQSKSTKNRFDAGDVLYGKLRPYLNKVLIADQPGFCTTEIVPIKCPAQLDTRFLYYWLKHPAFLRYVEAESHGMNMPRLGTEAGKAAPFVLAPRPEQTRIADQLDTLLARIKACNDHLDAIPGLLKRFRQAVMNAALAGMLDDLDGEATRQIVKVSDIATVGTGSTPLRSNGSFYSDTGTPWVTSAATGDAYVSNADQFVTPAAIAAHRLKVYPKGTLLVAMYGEGKTRGQVSELAIEATINQACAAICVDESRALTSFVKIALAANYLAMRELAEGGNQPNLNLSKIKDFEIPLPSLEVQVEILNRTNDLLAVADRIEAQYTAARSRTKRLASQVLDKAFRGELVPQDAKDEPASQLLQRIAAARAELPKTAPSGKKRGRKATEMPAAQPAMQTGLPAWMDLPADAWSDHGAVHDEHVVTAMLTAVLKAWGQPMPQEQARLAALLCLQPRLFTAALPADHAKQWRRLVGQAAEPLPAQVASLQPALNTPWRRALAGMRGRGDLLESGQGALASWSLGPEARHVDTSGWPDGRAAFTLAYLQTQGVGAVLPTLAVDAQAFVHARAA